jgi:hypothetical protein
MGSTQIIRDIATYEGETTPMHRWAMVIDGKTVSELWVAIETGEIMQVETPAAHQRNGYAGALYRQAASEVTIHHAPAGHRTPEGDAFARSVGGDALPCTYGCCSDDED